MAQPVSGIIQPRTQGPFPGHRCCCFFNIIIIYFWFIQILHWLFAQKCVRDNTHKTSMKIVQFSRLPTPLSSYVPNSSNPLTLDVQFQTTPPLQIVTNQLKENIIQGWLLYVIRSFFQVEFRFQYQLINLVWLSIDFFPFSWSQSRPQSNFKKLKTFFSPSSYNEKMR